MCYLQSGFEGDAVLLKVRPSRPAAATRVDKFTQPTLHLSNAVRDAKGSVRLAAVSGNDDLNVWLVRDPLDWEPAASSLRPISSRSVTMCFGSRA